MLAVALQACATTSPSPHTAHMEQARSAVAVHGPDAKVPGREHVAEQGVHVRLAPLVPSDVVPAAHWHALPAADQVAPPLHAQVMEPFTAFALPAPHALQAKTVLAAVGEHQPKPAAQAHALWPGCASAPSE